jgi:hypothetical protein
MCKLFLLLLLVVIIPVVSVEQQCLSFHVLSKYSDNHHLNVVGTEICNHLIQDDSHISLHYSLCHEYPMVFNYLDKLILHTTMLNDYSMDICQNHICQKQLSNQQCIRGSILTIPIPFVLLTNDDNIRLELKSHNGSIGLYNLTL